MLAPVGSLTDSTPADTLLGALGAETLRTNAAFDPSTPNALKPSREIYQRFAPGPQPTSITLIFHCI